jgi:flavin-dependent dehydrogenase
MLTIGDAAAFIDPFTGSGMLMALECGLLAGETIVRHLARLRDSGPFDLLESEYKKTYLRKFGSRLRTASLLRRAAFVSPLAEAAIIFFSGSTNLRRKLARATRPANFEIGSSAL